ncbi:MAG: B12-binding domain-containing radical SAM protein [bacterium]|nr:B12-binding domain-containing radical SAM protein [bacterium]
MKITFILPCVGKKPNEPYVKTWLMEPLAIAVLSSLTPPAIERVFYDDRLEKIPYDEPTDLVAINAESYSAKRAYQVAAKFRERGVPVVMGGFHPTLVPDEVETHADAVVVGAAEPLWQSVLEDFKKGDMKRRYVSGNGNSFVKTLPDRSIYRGKKYTKVTLIETGRGCPFHCEFCSIAQFFGRQYYARPIEDVVREIKSLKAKYIFFIDDNLVVDREHTKKLLKALIPLKIFWVGQISLSLSTDPEILELMKEAGCNGVLIGFESLNRSNLEAMGKNINTAVRDFNAAMKVIKKYGMAIYATFMFGYDEDTEEAFEDTLKFALRQNFFFTAFNHLVPFPGTPLHHRLEKENRLLYDKWWLSDEYRFGEIAFKPKHMSAQQLSQTCLKYRNKFYSFSSILKRGLDFSANCKSFFMAGAYFMQNVISRGDVARRQGLPMGVRE